MPPDMPDLTLPSERRLCVVRSLFDDLGSLVAGLVTAVGACAATALRTDHPSLYAILGMLVLSSLARVAATLAFRAREREGRLGDLCAWERLYVVLGTVHVACIGVWTLFVFWFTDDSAAELLAVSCGVGILIGIQGRNFSHLPLVRLQILAAGLPIGLAFAVKNDPWFYGCAAFFLLFLYGMLRTATRMSGTFLDAVDAARRNRELALRDSLTGLPNRAAMQDALRGATQRSASPFALHFIDLDRFKRINDTLGHGAGDMLLVQAATRFREVLGPGDLLARFAGDEFVVLQRDASPEAMEALCERLIAAAARPFDLRSSITQVGCSIGTAAYPLDTTDAEQLTQQADTALYHAKKEGRGRSARFTVEMGRREAERAELEADLRAAIRRDELTLAFQPILDAKTLRVTSLEALARWTHPVRGPVSPAEFIAIAEEAGLIEAITNRTLALACRTAAAWPSEAGVAVNLSPSQFRRIDLVRTIEAALQESGLPAGRLELEITESLEFDFDETVMERLAAIKALGCRLSLDDFGTGYSNLGHIASLPIDKVKIDRCFLPSSPEDARRLALFRGTVHFLSHLGYCVVVEGIETGFHLDLVTANPDVSQLQGFILGAPLPAHGVADLLRAQGGPETRGRRRPLRIAH